MNTLPRLFSLLIISQTSQKVKIFAAKSKDFVRCRINKAGTILNEAYRVLQPGGKIILHCANNEKMQSYKRFEQYGFSEEKMIYWLKQIRMYLSADVVEELLCNIGFRFGKRMLDERSGGILVYEK